MDFFNGNDKKVVEPLVDEMLYLESQLASIKKLPFIMVHPKKPTVQKITQAGKLYKDYLNQYTNCIKTLYSINKKSEQNDEKSPLRLYLEKIKSDSED